MTIHTITPANTPINYDHVHPQSNEIIRTIIKIAIVVFTVLSVIYYALFYRSEENNAAPNRSEMSNRGTHNTRQPDWTNLEGQITDLQRELKQCRTGSYFKIFDYHLDASALGRLKPGKWFNDQIMNICIQILINKAMDTQHNCLVTITHFYNLISTQPERINTLLNKRAKKTGAQVYNKIIIPINLNNAHWVLASLDMVKHEICYYDSFNHPMPPVIRENLTQALRYLDDDGAGYEWTFRTEKSPQQDNGFDCGVFTLKNIECILEGETIDATIYNQNDITIYRHNIATTMLEQERELVMGSDSTSSDDDYPEDDDGCIDLSWSTTSNNSQPH